MRDWRFSSVKPAGGVPRTEVEHLRQRRVGGLDGNGLQVDAQVGGQGGGVVPRPLARVARRHGQGVDVVGAEGVDGHGGHEGRVDTAGQTDDGVDESVLGQVVAGPEDERGVHLGVGIECRRQRRRRTVLRRRGASVLTGTTARSPPRGEAPAGDRCAERSQARRRRR